VKMFDADKTRMIALPHVKKLMTMLSRFHTIPACHGQTDRRTDRQTDRIAISISRVSVLTRDKNDIILAVLQSLHCFMSTIDDLSVSSSSSKEENYYN